MRPRFARRGPAAALERRRLLAAAAAFRVGVALLLATGATADGWQKSVGGAAIHDAELAARPPLAAGVAASTTRRQRRALSWA